MTIGYFMTLFIEHEGCRRFSREIIRIKIRSSHSASCIAYRPSVDAIDKNSTLQIIEKEADRIYGELDILDSSIAPYNQNEAGVEAGISIRTPSRVESSENVPCMLNTQYFVGFVQIAFVSFANPRLPSSDELVNELAHCFCHPHSAALSPIDPKRLPITRGF